MASNLSTSSSLDATLSSESRLILLSPEEDEEDDDDEVWVRDAGAEELRLKATGAGMADAFPLAPTKPFPLLGDASNRLYMFFWNVNVYNIIKLYPISPSVSGRP